MALKTAIIDDFAEQLKSRFELSELGELSFYLGCRITRDRTHRTTYICQDAYIDQLLERFHLTNADPVDTPMEANHKLMAASDDYIASNNQIQRYQSMVGGLMWAATQSRPDISYATSVLARYLRKPTDEHTNAAKRVLCYLKGTRKHGLTFTGTGVDDLNLQGFTDASWGDDIDSRRSTGGYVYKLCGGLISWKSGRQSIVTLSSTEAEFVSLTVAAKEAAAISRLLKEIMLY
jgi:hypothetical protein